ncbi:MAG: VOC family protein [Peptoniphilus sp.]|nr:VOC family protein [Peptoniphilus sp.]
MKYAHTCIRVADLDASIKFYKEALGYEVTRTKDFPDDKFTLVYLALPGDKSELELTYNYDEGPYDLGNGFGHLALLTPHLKEMHEKLKKEGYEVTDLMGLEPGIERFFFIKDPDGYEVEIIIED